MNEIPKVEAIEMPEGEEAKPPHGPFDHNDPLRLYRQLPQTTRDWLETLTPEKIEEMEEARIFMRDAKTVGKFGRWLFWASVGVFTAVVAFLQGIPLIKNILTGGK